MKNYQFTLSLPTLINPEKNHIFKYVSQFYNYIPINTIYAEEKIESLIKDEKTYHDMILNPLQYKTTKLKAWGKYITFITKLIPKEKKDILRIYILLEYFTQLMYNEKEFYNEKDYISYWNFYADNCRDDYEIFEKLIKKKICTENFQLYIGMSYIYERYHVFIKANDSFLKGFENCNYDEELNKCYKEFENRMLNRINREMSLSIIDSEEIDKYVHNEIYKNNNNNQVNRKRLFNEMQDENIEKGPKIIKMRFKIEKNQLIIFDDVSNNIRKGTQLVELYKLIVDYLNKNDSNFKAISDKFIRDLNIEHEKKPYSWLSNKRNIENQNLNNIMENIIIQNNNINNNEKNYINNNNNGFIENNNYNTNNQVQFQKLDIMDKTNNYSNPIYNNIINNKPSIINNTNQINNKSINDIVNILEKEISGKKTITNNIINDEYIKNEYNDIEEHKKKIEILKKKLNEEIDLLKKKEENLKLIEAERNQRIINKKNHLNIQNEKQNIINYNINLQNNNLLSKIPENNIQNNLDFSNNLKDFFLNQNITKNDILLKINEIGKLYNENKISLSKKNNFISLLENKLNEISKKEEIQIAKNKPDFNNIKPLNYNENQFKNTVNFPNELNKQNPFLPSPIQKINNLSFVFSNSNNNKNQKKNNYEINNISPLDDFDNNINNKNNLTPNINQFFGYEENNEYKKKDNKNSKKFENLFMDEDIDDINKEYNETNFSKLNDTFEIARRSNNNFTNTSSIIERNNESRVSSSIEKLFNS